MSTIKFWGRKKQVERKGYFPDKANKDNEYFRQLNESIYMNSRLIDFPKVDRHSLVRIYEQNYAVFSIVNRCADAIAKAVRYAELNDKDNNVIDSHWSIDLLRNPNDLESQKEFVKAWAINKLVLGDAFVYGMEGVGLKSGQFISQYIMPSQEVFIVRGGPFTPISGFTLSSNLTLNSELTPKNVMFSRDYNPDVTTNYGLSPLVSAAKLTYIIDNGLKRQNTTIQQGGVSAIVTPKEDITHGGPTEIAKQNTEEDLNQRRDGRHISYMRSPIDVHLLGDTPVNLALLDSSDSAVSALCFVYGYPYALYKSETTYDNQAAAKKILIENIGIPYAEDFLEKYTKFCRFENGEHWIINTDKIDELKKDVTEMLNAYDKSYRSYNDRAKLLELDTIDESWANEPIFPINVMPGKPAESLVSEQYLPSDDNSTATGSKERIPSKQ